MANFSIAHTQRVKDGEGWKDGATLWFKVTCWRNLAENAAESLRKGDLVLVHGELSEESFEGRDGQQHTAKTVTAKWCGPSLANATVSINRVQRQQGQPQGQQQGGWQQPGGWNPNAGQQQGQQPPPQGQGQWQQAAAPQDPWAQQGYGEPPF